MRFYGALIDLITAVDTTLRHPNLQPNLAPFAFGKDKIALHENPPRVVWVPAPDRFEASEQMRSPFPTVTAERIAGCEAHIWAVTNPGTVEDFRACELLLHQVIASLRANAPGKAITFNGGQWDHSDGAELTAYGRAYILSFGVRIPVLQTATQGGPTPITAVPQTSLVAPQT